VKEVKEAEGMDKETAGGSKEKEVELGDSLAYIPAADKRRQRRIPPTKS